MQPDLDADLASDARGDLGRLVTFSDAVVAIAATLLVLPLADHASQTGTPSLPDILAESGTQVLLFLLSFVVICRFWLTHHSIFRSLAAFDSTLFWINVVWLFSIVLLPYTTGLIGAADSRDPVTNGIYVANMLLTSLAGLGMQWHVGRSPQLIRAESRASGSHAPARRLAPSIEAVLAMAAALALVVFVPSVGLWALLLLTLTGVVDRLVIRRRPQR